MKTAVISSSKKDKICCSSCCVRLVLVNIKLRYYQKVERLLINIACIHPYMLLTSVTYLPLSSFYNVICIQFIFYMYTICFLHV